MSTQWDRWGTLRQMAQAYQNEKCTLYITLLFYFVDVRLPTGSCFKKKKKKMIGSATSTRWDKSVVYSITRISDQNI